MQLALPLGASLIVLLLIFFGLAKIDFHNHSGLLLMACVLAAIPTLLLLTRISHRFIADCGDDR
jgi:hypothetical protein